MNSKVDLKLDWCSYRAAKFAVERWHYSRTMPAGKRVNIGVWEDGNFIGSVIFGTGACPQIADPFNLKRQEAAELVRVALNDHLSSVSRIISIALKLLRGYNTNLRIIVSYADPEQGHLGKIYQAGNWIFLGETIPVEWFIEIATGKRIHSKTLRTGRRGYATKLKNEGIIRSIYLIKLKYVMPLDKQMRKQILPLAKPYPKRLTGESITSGDQPEVSGSSPTVRL